MLCLPCDIHTCEAALSLDWESTGAIVGISVFSGQALPSQSKNWWKKQTGSSRKYGIALYSGDLLDFTDFGVGIPSQCLEEDLCCSIEGHG